VQTRRDKAAAKRFFRRVLRSNPVPRKIVINELRRYREKSRDLGVGECEASTSKLQHG